MISGSLQIPAEGLRSKAIAVVFFLASLLSKEKQSTHLQVREPLNTHNHSLYCPRLRLDLLPVPLSVVYYIIRVGVGGCSVYVLHHVNTPRKHNSYIIKRPTICAQDYEGT